MTTESDKRLEAKIAGAEEALKILDYFLDSRDNDEDVNVGRIRNRVRGPIYSYIENTRALLYIEQKKTQERA